MRITLDTNVLVSAFISKAGQPAAVLDAILTFPEIELVLSNQILTELRDVLLRREVRTRFGYSVSDTDAFVNALRAVCELVRVKSDFILADDPKDNIIINTAYDGGADYIVSGDRHLDELKRFRGIRIVSPKSMLNILRRKFGEFIIPGS